MSKETKRLFLGLLALVIFIVLLVSARKGSAASSSNTTINNNGGIGSVEIPAFNLPGRTPIEINLPQMPGFPPFDFSMVSGCACGGSSVPFYTPSPVTQALPTVPTAIPQPQMVFPPSYNYSSASQSSSFAVINQPATGYYNASGQLTDGIWW